jgi:hypothetical protein
MFNGNNKTAEEFCCRNLTPRWQAEASTRSLATTASDVDDGDVPTTAPLSSWSLPTTDAVGVGGGVGGDANPAPPPSLGGLLVAILFPLFLRPLIRKNEPVEKALELSARLLLLLLMFTLYRTSLVGEFRPF